MKYKNLLSKKSLIILLVMVLLGGSLVLAESQTIMQGDVDGNGIVNIVDALRIAQYAAGLGPSPFILGAGDVNCDGAVNILDALVVARYTAGAILTMTCNPNIIVTIYVNGHVYDSQTKLPIAGAQAYLEKSLGATDLGGYYRVGSVYTQRPNSVKVIVQAGGYITQTFTVNVPDNNEAVLDVELVRSPSPTPTPTFYITPTPVETLPVAGDIINAKSAKLISTDSTTGSTVLVQRAYNAPTFSDNVQAWDFKAQTDGYYAIVSRQTGKALTVENASTQTGAYVSTDTLLSTGNAHQQWKFFTTLSGYLKIVNRQSGLYLGVEGASLLDNARLVQVANTNGSEILWGTAEAVTPPSPTGCDMIGHSFCLRVNGSALIKENSTTPIILKISATKLTASPPPIKGSNIVVNYSLRGNTWNGQDMEYLTGQVTVFAANYTGGDTTTPPADGTITIRPIDDLKPEGVEYFMLILSYPEATDISNGGIYIVDDDLQ